MNLNEAIAIYAGGPGSGCQGPNCGRPVGNTHDHTGKIPVPADIAKKGADIAERVSKADSRLDSASREHSNIQYGKNNQPRRGPKAAKEIAQAKANYDTATKAYHAVRKESEEFKATHGLTSVDAWEAHTGRPWPHYLVDSRSNRAPKHYVPKD